MARVMAVSFERHGVLYYLDAGEQDYAVGEAVLYPTQHGPEVALCVWPPQETETGVDFPLCAGPASQSDLERDAANRRRRAEARLVAERLVAEHDLPMKVLAVDYVDRSDDFDQQVVVYFSAPSRVDFRALLGDLARSLRARIDLRQVAARDAARLIGGIGGCGRELCCTTFLSEIEPVGQRLARIQVPAGNPLQITGACGKLLCCLRYEHPLYLDFARSAPRVGSQVQFDGEDAQVIGHRVPDGTVLLKLVSGETRRCCPAALGTPQEQPR